MRDWLDGVQRPLSAAAPALATTTIAIAVSSRAPSVLAEHDEAGQRGDRRLERHQHAEDGRRQPPQRLELERVGQHRRRERDDERRAEQVGRRERAAALDEAGREHDQRADRHRERQPRAARERLRRCAWTGGCRPSSRAAAEQREQHAERVDRAAARVGEQHDPGRGEHDPDAVERPARAEHGDEQRAGELDRDRDAERDPVDRLVDRPVHQPERDAERAREPQVAARGIRGRQIAHSTSAASASRRNAAPPGPSSSNSVDRERRADLQRARRGEHQAHRDAPLTAHRRSQILQGSTDARAHGLTAALRQRWKGSAVTRVAIIDPQPARPRGARDAAARRAGDGAGRRRHAAPTDAPRAARPRAPDVVLLEHAPARRRRDRAVPPRSRPSGRRRACCSTPRSPTRRSSCWRASPAPTGSSTRPRRRPSCSRRSAASRAAAPRCRR